MPRKEKDLDQKRINLKSWRKISETIMGFAIFPEFVEFELTRTIFLTFIHRHFMYCFYCTWKGGGVVSLMSYFHNFLGESRNLFMNRIIFHAKFDCMQLKSIA